jgi:sulfur-oxidizing protein SoxZ
MATASRPRIKLPDGASIGEMIEIKALITHVMETGNRKTADGKPIPRDIIHSFSATFAGNPVFSAEFGSGIAANPFIAFSMRVPGPGEFELTWVDDQGNKTVEKAVLNIVPGPPPG